MSAIKDPSQNTTFIFSNFYHLYRKGKIASQPKADLVKGVVLKPAVVQNIEKEVEVKVSAPAQSEEIANWSHFEMESAKRQVAHHLRSLRESKRRLSFLMQEIDEILKRS